MKPRKSRSGRSKKSSGKSKAKKTRPGRAAAAKKKTRPTRKKKTTTKTRPSIQRSPTSSEPHSATHETMEELAERLAKLPPYTLDEAISSADFKSRGLFQLQQLAAFLASFVDGQSVGLFASTNPETRSTLIGLASVIKAGLQWFLFEPNERREFVVAAERYLVDGPSSRRMVQLACQSPHGWHPEFRPGPVALRRQGRGRAGRLHGIRRQRHRIEALLRVLSPTALQEHHDAFLHPESARAKQGCLLPRLVAEVIFFDAPQGVHAELFAEQDFRWPDVGRYFRTVEPAINAALANIDVSRSTGRAKRLREGAEVAIRKTLEALGLKVDKDYFRYRRSERG